MSKRKPTEGDLVWLKPAKITEVTGNGHCRLQWDGDTGRWFPDVLFERFEPAPWKPEPGKQTIECDGKTVWDIVWVGPFWSIVRGPGDEFPVLTAKLREP